MLDNATLNQLRELRLSAMAASFKEQLNKPDMSSLTFEERFAFLVEAEWLNRKSKRTERLIRQAAANLWFDVSLPLLKMSTGRARQAFQNRKYLSTRLALILRKP